MRATCGISRRARSNGCNSAHAATRINSGSLFATLPQRANAGASMSRRTHYRISKMPRDSFNREINYLRISITDRCNLRCVYCMPLEGLRFLPNAEMLTAEEIERVVRAAVSVGFRKFRLTGGEPTLRLDLLEIIERVAAIDGVDDLALTTNALLMTK